MYTFCGKQVSNWKEKGNASDGRVVYGISSDKYCGFHHPEIFSALGIFSGFVTDIIQGTELDMVERPLSDNEHLKIFENAHKFGELFPIFLDLWGMKTHFGNILFVMIKFWNKKGYLRSVKIYKGAHDWNVWRQSLRDFAQMIFREQ